MASKEKILVVDDEPSIRKYLQTLLEVDGFDVETVSSGREALEKVRAGLTSLEEVFRVIPFSPDAPARCRVCKRHLNPDFFLCPYCGADRMEPQKNDDDVSNLQSMAKGDA